MKFKNSKAFTLLEILLVIGIISILAGIVVLAINPSRVIAKSRNLQRKIGVTEINKGIDQYYVDHGSYPSTITPNLTSICDTGAKATSTGIDCEGKIDLSLLVPTYLPAIPVDPTGDGYYVARNSSRKVFLTAPRTELGDVIAIGTPDPVIVVDNCGISGDVTDSDCWSDGIPGKIWGPSGVVTGATDENVGSTNTAILAAITPGVDDYPAADYCASLVAGGFDNWYLPSRSELMGGITYQYITTLTSGTSGFLSGIQYWTSTESSDTNAWSIIADNGFMGWVISENDNTKTISNRYTRCLR